MPVDFLEDDTGVTGPESPAAVSSSDVLENEGMEENTLTGREGLNNISQTISL